MWAWVLQFHGPEAYATVGHTCTYSRARTEANARRQPHIERKHLAGMAEAETSGPAVPADASGAAEAPKPGAATEADDFYAAVFEQVRQPRPADL